MKLLIVESPAKAKTISKYLDGAYEVRASIGHVRDLPKSNKKAIDIEGGFIPHYEISIGKEKVIADIKSLAKKADEVILATDPDREGEAIAWHIVQAIGLDSGKWKVESGKPKKVRRVVFHEITKEAIKEAMGHPRDIDQNLRIAQEARRVLDRLVGYDLSGIIWKKVRYGLSAGRVQSPALRIIMEREREIRAFKPEDFFVISGIFETENKNEKVKLVCEVEPRERKEADRIVEEAKKAGKENKWKVISVDTTEAKRSAKPPFTTSTLQQTASTRLGFSPFRTMRAAQKLYEAGAITYMRTDSTNLSSFALTAIAKKVESLYGKEYVETKNYATKSKNAQEAHEAIRPTDIAKLNLGANEDEKRLYKLIWQRSAASQMASARLLRTKIKANIEGETIPNFSITGSTITFDGWLKADPEASGEENILPKVKAKESLKLEEINQEAKQTEAPNRYTEAGLIKELEKRGIGRPSTYASIIKTLEDREYVTKEGRTLTPTDTGDVVSTFLEENFGSYISDDFTAKMEDKLDDIANGEAEYVQTLKDYYIPLSKEVKLKEKLEKATTFGVADPKYKCPKCGSGLLVKLSRSGRFMSCEKFPDCDGALTIEGFEIKKDEPMGVHPETGLPIFIKIGRFGPYVQMGETPPKKTKVKKTKKDRDIKTDETAHEAPSPKLQAYSKPRMASIPKEYDPTKLTMAEAVKFLSLPRELGIHPDTGLMISANKGRFGPYIVHEKDFRSLKKDDVFTITFERAMEILREPKKVGRGRFKKKEK